MFCAFTWARFIQYAAVPMFCTLITAFCMYCMMSDQTFVCFVVGNKSMCFWNCHLKICTSKISMNFYFVKTRNQAGTLKRVCWYTAKGHLPHHFLLPHVIGEMRVSDLVSARIARVFNVWYLWDLVISLNYKIFWTLIWFLQNCCLPLCRIVNTIEMAVIFSLMFIYI